MQNPGCHYYVPLAPGYMIPTAHILKQSAISPLRLTWLLCLGPSTPLRNVERCQPKNGSEALKTSRLPAAPRLGAFLRVLTVQTSLSSFDSSLSPLSGL